MLSFQTIGQLRSRRNYCPHTPLDKVRTGNRIRRNGIEGNNWATCAWTSVFLGRTTSKNNSHGYYSIDKGCPLFFPVGDRDHSRGNLSCAAFRVLARCLFKIFEPLENIPSNQPVPSSSKSRSTIRSPRPSPPTYLHSENQIRVSWKFNHPISRITTRDNACWSVLKGQLRVVNRCSLAQCASILTLGDFRKRSR